MHALVEGCRGNLPKKLSGRFGLERARQRETERDRDACWRVIERLP